MILNTPTPSEREWSCPSAKIFVDQLAPPVDVETAVLVSYPLVFVRKRG